MKFIKKNLNKYLFLISVFLLLFFNVTPALALEIKDYPNVPGIASPVEGNLGTYIAYLFGVGSYIAGVIAVISFAVGAVQLIMAASNPSLVNEAKDRMKGSVLGLVLTLSAIVILRTINPQITEVTLTELPVTEGIFYTNNSDFKPAPNSEADTSNIPTGYKALSYKCSAGPVLLIWKFPKKNFVGSNENYGGVVVTRKKCGETEGLSGYGSFKVAFETPGVYYCMNDCNGNMCSGYMSESMSSSTVLPAPFKNNLKSVRIVNDLTNDLHYGIVFHSKDDPSAAGNCSKIFYSTDKNKEIECFNNISNSASATVFYWNDKDYQKSGTGIDFYSEPFGWNEGARAGKYFLNSDTIKDFWTGNAQSLPLTYTGIRRPDKYKEIYQNFRQRSGSIDIKGNYTVILWAGPSCQVFFKDIVNLKSTELTINGANIDKINVIPIK